MNVSSVLHSHNRNVYDQEKADHDEHLSSKEKVHQKRVIDKEEGKADSLIMYSQILSTINEKNKDVQPNNLWCGKETSGTITKEKEDTMN